MAGTNNSISTLLTQFMRLENNALAILSQLNNATTSAGDSLVISQTDSSGTTQTYNVPTFGWFKAELNRIDNNTLALAGLGNGSAIIRMPDGSIKQIIAAEALSDPTPIQTVPNPQNFLIKNNWFFDSFLNPLLYVNFDVTGQVPVNMEKAVVKRILVQANTQGQEQWFDTNYKGRTDVDYLTLLKDLSSNSISYFVDEEVVSLPVSIMQFTGSFDVLNATNQQTVITSTSGTITTTVRKYTLNTLNYTDVTTGLVGTKTLKNGDQLVLADGTRYTITSVDSAENTVVLNMTSGHTAITIGVGVLSIYSQPFNSQQIQVGIGHNERQVVFLKPVEPAFNVASTTYSPGSAFFSNELTISTPTGPMDLDTYYKGQVSDFGLLFIAAAKERTIPAVYGEIPDTPLIDVNNFQVTQVNSHITDATEVNTIKSLLSSKTQISNQLSQLNAAINTIHNNLNNNSATLSPAEIQQQQAQLTSLTQQQLAQSNLYASVVNQIATIATQNPASATLPDFRLRGFFPMPSPVPSSTTNPQETIQFVYSYRKLGINGNAPNTQQLTFVDSDGNTKTAFFSNWTNVVSPIRQRVYNTITGFYEWAPEDVTNAELVNINQVDIPIQPGEQVELKVMSISEAGWPLNPMQSDWSPSVTIPFPQDLQINSDISELLANAQAEATRVAFQTDLTSMGLDQHLSNSFTSGAKYYAHQGTDIASGFFDANSNVINLFDYLTNITNKLNALQALIAQAKGTLVVYILDTGGNITKVTPNQTIQLFAGFYKQLIQTGPSTYNWGQIVTSQYTLRLENSAASTLELASYMPGGLNQLAFPTPTTNDYSQNRLYANVPVSLSGLNNTQVLAGAYGQLSPFQSGQVQSMWIYCRERNIGLNTDLYAPQVSGSGPYPTGYQPSNTYNFTGTASSPYNPTILTPVNGFHLLPFSPSVITSTTDPNVWNGTTSVTGIPQGGGYLTEFCLHASHPVLSTLGNSYTFNPTLFSQSTITTNLSGQNIMSYPNFVHSIYFCDDTTSTNGTYQLQYVQPVASPLAPGSTLYYVAGTAPTATMENWPAKLGFYKNDMYLIGRYTCGAYLYLAPVNYNIDVNVDGSTATAVKDLLYGEDKAINIPLVFQMRAADILGYVGGYRTTGNITNITYTKTLGIDIQVQNESLFSFDVQVSCKYDQDSLVQPTYIPNVTLDRLSAIRTTTQTVQTGG